MANLTYQDVTGTVRLTPRTDGMENVCWPGKDAVIAQEQVKVTIFAWSYEQKRGSAMLPGGEIVEVQMQTVLTVVTRH